VSTKININSLRIWIALGWFCGQIPKKIRGIKKVIFQPLHNFKPEGVRSHGRPRCGWDTIKMDCKETRWNGMDLINMAQDWDK
jgi:hypothetical protein